MNYEDELETWLNRAAVAEYKLYLIKQLLQKTSGFSPRFDDEDWVEVHRIVNM